MLSDAKSRGCNLLFSVEMSEFEYCSADEMDA